MKIDHVTGRFAPGGVPFNKFIKIEIIKRELILGGDEIVKKSHISFQKIYHGKFYDFGLNSFTKRLLFIQYNQIEIKVQENTKEDKITCTMVTQSTVVGPNKGMLEF